MNNKKRLGSAFVLCIMATVMIGGATSYTAQAETVKNQEPLVIARNIEDKMTDGKTTEYEYKASKTEVILTKYIGTEDNVKIPATIAGLPVTGLGENAFENNTKIKSIEISDGVKYIANDAFNGCSSLEKVVLSKGLEQIGERAFAKCKSLKSIDITSGVSVIGYDIFKDCTSLKSISLPSGVKDIPIEFAAGCTSLESVNIPDGTTIIRMEAFDGCTNLRTITIPSSVKNIEGAFQELKHITICGEKGSFAEQYAKSTNIQFKSDSGAIADKDLENTDFQYISNSSEIEITKYVGKETEVKIPETIDGVKVTSIGDSAFKNNNKITSVSIPEGVQIIDKSAFEGCENLKSITLPDSVTKIRESAFSGCKDLKTIVLGQQLELISDQAFANCASLEKIDIPSTVRNIYISAFNGCTSLAEINVDKGSSAYLSKDGMLYCKDGTNLLKCPAAIEITEFTMPEDVVYLDYYAFKECVNLQSVVINNEKIKLADMVQIIVKNKDNINIDVTKLPSPDATEDTQENKTKLSMTVAEIEKAYLASKVEQTSKSDNSVSSIADKNITEVSDNNTIKQEDNVVSDSKAVANVADSSKDTTANTFDASGVVSLMSIMTLSGATIVTSRKIRK